MKEKATTLLALITIALTIWGAYWIFGEIWSQIKLLDPTVSVGIFTAASTIIVATLTVVIGKQFERAKDIEAHYREKKTEIYDEFLTEFYKTFYSGGDNGNEESDDMVDFLREWQRKIILWGGPKVLLKYIAWMTHLKKCNPDAQTIFLMGDFFLEIRKDLGHKNTQLEKGTFAHLILQNPEFFLAKAKENPNITLDEISEAEEKLMSGENV